MLFLTRVRFIILITTVIYSSLSVSDSRLPANDVIVNKTGILPICSATGSASVVIPTSRTSKGVYNATNQGNVIFELQNQNLKCADKYGTLKIPLNLEKEITLVAPKSYSNVLINKNEAHQHSYFTLSGYFYDHTSRYFYKPDGDYCVSSYTDSDITLRICTVDCSESETPNTWCVPKCCALDEAVDFWKMKCSRTEGSPWTPPIYKDINNADQRANNDSSINLIFQMSQLHKNCNLKVFSKTKCGFKGFRWLSSSEVPNPYDLDFSQEADDIKMIPRTIGKTGMIQIIGWNNESNHWEDMPNMVDFCVDHFVTNGLDTTDDDFVIYHCDREDEKELEEDASAVTNTIIYSVVSIAALVFLFATICVYAALWDRHNLHGLTIFSYTIANFGSYLFLILAHIVFLISVEDCEGTLTTGPICYGIAVLAHYFFISSYLWLTVMNFDLWWTFSSVRAVRRDSKELGKFGWYSVFAWIFPMVLVITFVVIDQVYSYHQSPVTVPGYATGSCFVTRNSRGQYIYIPMAIMLGTNLVLIGLTMKIFISANQASKFINSGDAKKANRYSAKLFAKLFIVMGGAYVVDFLTWYYNDKDEDDKHWAIAVLEGITYLAPVALFVLFCLNDRVVNQLSEKYPALKDALDLLKCFRKTDKTRSTSEHSSNKTNSSSYNKESEMVTMGKPD